jgi:SET and MYND domain-containing protein
MEGIIDTNGFELIQFKDLLKMQGLPDSELRLGLFELMSMFNHCCEANCLRFSVGPSMVVYALREIREGDELFISYFKMMSVDGRRNTLKNWGIDCRCVLCE